MFLVLFFFISLFFFSPSGCTSSVARRLDSRGWPRAAPDATDGGPDTEDGPNPDGGGPDVVVSQRGRRLGAAGGSSCTGGGCRGSF
jgi:hypothetical protein